MTRPFLASDPLWRCLCPRWNSGNALRVLRGSPQRSHTTTSSPRYLHQNTTFEHDRAKRGSWMSALSPDETYSQLQRHAKKGNVAACNALARRLIETGSARADSTRLYNELILCNVDTELGGAWRVRDLLEEMEQNGAFPDAGTWHNVLRVLAVHPDHLLLSDVLTHMREAWVTVSSEALYDVAASLIRTGSIESAADVIETIKRQDTTVPAWLLDLYVYSLCDIGALNAANEIMQERVDAGELDISRALWSYFLDAAASARHFKGTELAWARQVGLNQMQATTGMVENALATAARHGSPALATRIFEHMVQRGDPATHMHYEQLIDSYLRYRVPDVDKAINVLSIMATERLPPTKWQTRSLFAYLRSDPERTTHALETVRRLHKDGRIVPIAAINVLLECFVHQRDADSALKLHREARNLLSNNPPDKSSLTLETYSILLLTGRELAGLEAESDVIITDMLNACVEPDKQLYRRMVDASARAAVNAAQKARDNCEDPKNAAEQHAAIAKTRYQQMLALDMSMDVGTMWQLALSMAVVGDSSCFDFVYHPWMVNSNGSRSLYRALCEWMPAPDGAIAPETEYENKSNEEPKADQLHYEGALTAQAAG